MSPAAGRGAVASAGGLWTRRLGAVAAVLAVVAITGCKADESTPPPSTFGTNSPWLGTFTAVGLPTPVNSLTALDCPSAKRCWAVGSTVGGGGAPNGAAVIASPDGGVNWTPQVIPPTVGYLSGVACSDVTHCTAVGQTSQATSGQAVIITTTDGGAQWAQVAAPPGVLDLTAVSCQTSGWCLAVGMVGAGPVALVSATSGASWVQQGVLPATMSGATAISCVGDQHCWVTGQTAVASDHVVGALVVTTDGGTTWATVPTPPGIGSLNGISCLSGSPTGSGALPVPSTTSTVPPTTAPGTAPTTTAAPGTGSTPVPPATSTTTTTAPPPTTAPVPPTTTTPIVGVPGVRCTVVGTTADTLNGARIGHGLIFTTDNGGATWSNQAVAPTSASLTGVSCTAIGTCVTVGSSVLSAPQAGLVVVTGSPSRPWKSASAVGSPQPLTAVSCTSVSRCVVVGEAISEHLAGG